MARRRTDPLTRELRELAPRLDHPAAPAPPPELVHQTLRAARVELAQTQAEAAPARTRPSVPRGFAGEFARVLAATALPVALVALVNVQIVRVVPELLGRVLPEGLALAVAVAYAAGSFGWLALACGSLPLAAHRRAWQRERGLR